MAGSVFATYGLSRSSQVGLRLDCAAELVETAAMVKARASCLIIERPPPARAGPSVTYPAGFNVSAASEVSKGALLRTEAFSPRLVT